MTIKAQKTLIYGLDDRPPWPEALLLALQHFIILTPRLVYPAIVVQGMAGPPELVAAMLAMTMIAAGLGTLLQVNRKGLLGSGFLDPAGCGAAYLHPSIQAGLLGGPALIFGMTVMAGLFECLFARAYYRLRALFPPHVLGLVATMVGLSLIVPAVRNFAGGPEGLADPAALPANLLTGLITLATTLAVSVWGRGKVKLYCLLAGIIAGYAAALALGVAHWDHFSRMFAGPLLALPGLAHLGWSFDPALVVVFLIAALATALKTSGEIVTCQKLNNPAWQHPDNKRLAGGILADGAATILSGLLGGIGLSSSAANIGLSMATRATSRRIAFVTAAVLIGLAFMPPVIFFFTNLPKPVAGASLIFVASFMVVTGIQMMTLRMLDARKTYVIGISFIFGLSVSMVPQLYAQAPEYLEPIFTSSLALATLSAVLLNALFRLGVSDRVLTTVGEDGRIPSSREVFSFMEANGAAWAARRDIIQRAAAALNEVVEHVMGDGLNQGPLRVEARFDEFNLDLEIAYPGRLMVFTAPAAGACDLASEEMLDYLAGQMVQRLVDRVRTSEQKGACLIRLHLDH